ncbi:tRNA (guanosine(37)-N1)-methyltransferase TrmD [Cytophaga hutchinsonii]|jgi:tRNA (guanine37-N1)-methyltransferase|uniref:tRNA (guanine-N(1)-)-methyltransferase n=1 Tax=Cytophaga hutchinsonii (strain ATCC 33406 / DSM 1761 / CIP 103989 / NBRC 15051 / NCIMB 9469 / D465) TaxID=269798 RepID=TRMD_CYTH3|nr:tRNA (guanosine(37)-N1)-methyltransferase TrmD [Cytophaga hutchinsonii]Q11YV4.1 RecName: Full=tRNA (guanine-N(1)-)-methyltransferase; AltName: Full=M1G-methyltransferase; AltName: Full=tRNA [GM37] methyltransferase [Cytophaga hutchinsonii ATCC 33406]ABG57412.1 tRNA (Guanine37-N(1)-) methyltransferase [Cytophaga hutchinsonii ATCC 33406]SFX97695.1 tRNA (Guanine37-N(1)-) methyltransferase [Cytophaga hutchinsonii ATCC 33406]
MRIDIITCLPKLLDSFFGHSILKRAQEKGIAEVVVHDLRTYTLFKHKQVDDYSYGGSAGMVLMVEPIDRCITALKAEREYDAVIYMTPDGKTFDQQTANRFSLYKNIIILCGHYKGVDERARQAFITHEISIGDYVLSGGELAAAVVSDALIRLIPGVLSDETSALTDSFQDSLLAPAVYTRPADYKGMIVPEILLSGNEKEIEKWRFENALERTKERRPDLYQKFTKAYDADGK